MIINAIFSYIKMAKLRLIGEIDMIKLKFKGFIVLSLLVGILTACQHRLACNRWTEKDCYYSDYYQSAPLHPRDQCY